MFDIEFDLRTIISIGLGIGCIVGLYFLFGLWATKGYEPKLHIKLACYVLAPIVSYFIIQYQANKE